MSDPPPVWKTILICTVLTFVTLALYWEVAQHEFVSYDDMEYVNNNPRVQAGLTWSGLLWAFTTTQACNWHPLTWLSHMLDCQLFGLDAGAHHVVNMLFHVLNALLLFLLLKRITGDMWPSAVVAALFAWHPLHVESVAWVSERKDMLSACFWLLTILAYVRYVEGPAFNRYCVVLICFALGLMAKPMVVTLPFVLLLLDYWPLRRFPVEWSAKVGDQPRSCSSPPASLQRLVWEKVPLLMLAGACSAVTFVIQQSSGAVKSAAAFPIWARLVNSLVSYAAYLGKAFWPTRLAVFYSFPASWPWWQVVGAVLLLIGLTALAIRTRMTRPYLAVGWFWYLGTLVPVIGLVQVGGQAMADRYTYIPLIGFFVMVTWGIARTAANSLYRGKVLIGVATAILAGCVVITRFQVQHWRNSETLARHALNVTTSNYVAYSILGLALADQGELDQAVEIYAMVLRSRPDYADARQNLGLVLAMQNKLDDAIICFQQTLRIIPQSAHAHYGLALALARQNRTAEALPHYREALRLRPDWPEALNNLAWLLATHSDAEYRDGAEAVRLAQRACALTRHREAVYVGTLAAALAEADRYAEAVTTAQKAAELARSSGQNELAATNERLLELYRSGRPCRENDLIFDQQKTKP